MRFQVPQFIEVEDKIFGSLTFRQFIYLAGAGGIGIAMWLLLPKWIAVLIAAPFVALGLALAFYRVNERPFIDVMESAFNYYILGNKLYIWQKKESTQDKKPQENPADAMRYVPTISASKIKDLAWSLDIKESIYSDKEQK